MHHICDHLPEDPPSYYPYPSSLQKKKRVDDVIPRAESHQLESLGKMMVLKEAKHFLVCYLFKFRFQVTKGNKPLTRSLRYSIRLRPAAGAHQPSPPRPVISSTTIAETKESEREEEEEEEEAWARKRNGRVVCCPLWLLDFPSMYLYALSLSLSAPLPLSDRLERETGTSSRGTRIDSCWEETSLGPLCVKRENRYRLGGSMTAARQEQLWSSPSSTLSRSNGP